MISIDMVRPPGMGMPDMPTIRPRQMTVADALTTKMTAEKPTNPWSALGGSIADRLPVSYAASFAGLSDGSSERGIMPGPAGRAGHRASEGGQLAGYSSWRRHQMPSSLRPLGARSSHWYMPQRLSSPRA